ncbi:G patch domain-containing protein 8-like [Bactrocera neohumeralis]|uniref:G patch domain-containing protein 8-like n=1 Tax=Bactrocera neohumeralis TaxID=98809 RepID=UPI002165ECEF|nr:G patch domain-containing protein 8-like [Bactrocera neohumeralis]
MSGGGVPPAGAAALPGGISEALVARYAGRLSGAADASLLPRGRHADSSPLSTVPPSPLQQPQWRQSPPASSPSSLLRSGGTDGWGQRRRMNAYPQQFDQSHSQGFSALNGASPSQLAVVPSSLFTSDSSSSGTGKRSNGQKDELPFAMVRPNRVAPPPRPHQLQLPDDNTHSAALGRDATSSFHSDRRTNCSSSGGGESGTLSNSREGLLEDNGASGTEPPGESRSFRTGVRKSSFPDTQAQDGSFGDHSSENLLSLASLATAHSASGVDAAASAATREDGDEEETVLVTMMSDPNDINENAESSSRSSTIIGGGDDGSNATTGEKTRIGAACQSGEAGGAAMEPPGSEEQPQDSPNEPLFSATADEHEAPLCLAAPSQSLRRQPSRSNCCLRDVNRQEANGCSTFATGAAVRPEQITVEVGHEIPSLKDVKRGEKDTDKANKCTKRSSSAASATGSSTAAAAAASHVMPAASQGPLPKLEPEVPLMNPEERASSAPHLAERQAHTKAAPVTAAAASANNNDIFTFGVDVTFERPDADRGYSGGGGGGLTRKQSGKQQHRPGSPGAPSLAAHAPPADMKNGLFPPGEHARRRKKAKRNEPTLAPSLKDKRLLPSIAGPGEVEISELALDALRSRVSDYVRAPSPLSSDEREGRRGRRHDSSSCTSSSYSASTAFSDGHSTDRHGSRRETSSDSGYSSNSQRSSSSSSSSDDSGSSDTDGSSPNDSRTTSSYCRSDSSFSSRRNGRHRRQARASTKKQSNRSKRSDKKREDRNAVVQRERRDNRRSTQRKSNTRRTANQKRSARRRSRRARASAATAAPRAARLRRRLRKQVAANPSAASLPVALAVLFCAAAAGGCYPVHAVLASHFGLRDDCVRGRQRLRCPESQVSQPRARRPRGRGEHE